MMIKITNNLLSSIKNLKLIQFYQVYENTNTLGLKIIYGNDEIFSADYRDEKFYEYVNYVINLYNIEKNNNFIYLNNFTGETIQNINIPKPDNDFYQTFPIVELGRLHFRIKIIEEYIINMSKNILSSIFLQDKNINITSFKGYKNNFMLLYEVIDEFSSVDNICLYYNIHRIDNNKYLIKTKQIENKLFNFEATLEFSKNSVNITWNGLNSNFIGRNINHFEEANNTNVIKFNNNGDENYIYLEQPLLDINDTTHDHINSYLDNCNLGNISSLKSYVLNQYLSKEEEFKDDKFDTKYYHITLKPSVVKIHYVEEVGYLKENNFRLITENKENEFTFLKFSNNGRDYVLRQTEIQKDYLSKYNYCVYGNPSNDLLNFTNFEDIQRINDNVESITDIKKLIK